LPRRHWVPTRFSDSRASPAGHLRERHPAEQIAGGLHRRPVPGDEQIEQHPRAANPSLAWTSAASGEIACRTYGATSGSSQGSTSRRQSAPHRRQSAPRRRQEPAGPLQVGRSNLARARPGVETSVHRGPNLDRRLVVGRKPRGGHHRKPSLRSDGGDARVTERHPSRTLHAASHAASVTEAGISAWPTQWAIPGRVGHRLRRGQGHLESRITGREGNVRASSEKPAATNIAIVPV